MWKGGVTSQNLIDRSVFRQTIQDDVFERDDYTCVMCGATGDLTVDHIQSWKDYVELRFSIDNCRTLCQKCHYKVTYSREMPKEVRSWGHNFGRRVTKFA
jgi:5-methylcytosine-specific restriction endonuclease McrA